MEQETKELLEFTRKLITGSTAIANDFKAQAETDSDEKALLVIATVALVGKGLLANLAKWEKDHTKEENVGDKL